VALGISDVARTVHINHSINNVPAIEPITIPAIDPLEMQLHELLLVPAEEACRAWIGASKVL
jgi:hypothetical protein